MLVLAILIRCLAIWLSADLVALSLALRIILLESTVKSDTMFLWTSGLSLIQKENDVPFLCILFSIERMEEHCGCWIQENPLRVTENILTAVAVDPNGLRLQLVQLSGTGLYEDEDETKKGGRALPERIFNRNWEVKFGDLHIQHSRPAALAQDPASIYT